MTSELVNHTHFSINPIELAPGMSIVLTCLNGECLNCTNKIDFFLNIGEGLFNKETLESYNRFCCDLCKRPVGITGCIYSFCQFTWFAFTKNHEGIYDSCRLENGEIYSVPFREKRINIDTWNTVVEINITVDMKEVDSLDEEIIDPEIEFLLDKYFE